MCRFSGTKTFLALVAFCLAVSFMSWAQQPEPAPDGTVDASTRAQVIETLLKRLNDSYVFPEVAKRMEAAIRDHVSRKDYDQLTSARSFGETLTRDLQAISKDKHLRVRYSHEPIPVREPRREPTAEEREEARRDYTWMNHGFNKVERLRGNVGYVEFMGFFDAELGADTVASTMNFLNGTDADY